MEDCVILFLHHQNDDITKYHLEMFQKYNPNFKVVALNPSSSPKSNLWLYDNMWMYNDTMIYDWVDSNNFIEAKRYCWFDWDTLCNQSVDEYYGDNWDDDIVGTNIYTNDTNPGWQWFNHARIKKDLNKYNDKFVGISPFCGILCSREALFESINQMRSENHLWKDQNNEFRFSTCANICNIPIKKINRDSIQAFGYSNKRNGKILHPVKIMSKEQNKLEEFKDIVVVSSAFSLNDEIIRDLNASREVYKNWDINFIGRGKVMKSYIEAKIIAIKEFIELNKDMFEWVILMDSNDTLVIKDFDSKEILKILKSFKKPIIFSGEANCYPLEELKGLYTSNSKLKYLNSGVIVAHKDFILPLLNHVLYLFNEFPQYNSIGFNPPGDQTYFSLCYFSKEIGDKIAIDEEGLISVSTALVEDKYFNVIDNIFLYNGNSSPYILHCQGNDKHDRKRGLMKKLNIEVRG